MFLSLSEKSFSNKHARFNKTLNWQNLKLNFSFPQEGFLQTSELTISLIGQIFIGNDNPLDFITKAYKSKGVDFLDSINGHFLLVIIDHLKEEIFVVTDRVNSKKVFIKKTDNSISFSTSIYQLSGDTMEIDKVAIGQYVSSGFLYNSRTFLKGIRVAKSATTYHYKSGGWAEDNYWKLRFQDTFEISEKQLEQKLLSLIKESIVKRKDDCDLAVSLSGGYDATCIQLIMSDFGHENLKYFSYHCGRINPQTDAWVAREQARYQNNKIEFYEAFDGNFDQFLLDNAKYGQGISNICFETNVWNTIGNGFPVFTGEEFFGMRDERTGDPQILLKRLGFFDWSNIKSSISYFNKDFIEESQIDLRIDHAQMIEQTNESGQNPFDQQMALYFNHRLPNVLMNWRAFFTGRNNLVQMPLLDNHILDFITRLPYNARNNKSLFKNMLLHHYPDFFNNIKRATKTDNYNWRDIVLNNKNTIIEILSKNNNLESAMMPEAIEKMLVEENNSFELGYKVLKKANRIIRLPTLLNPQHNVPHHLLILRILVIELFLSEFQNSTPNE